MKKLDELNTNILGNMLSRVKLRKEFSFDDIISIFKEYQGYINTTLNRKGETNVYENRERMAKRAISILLYGVMEK